MNQDNRLPSPVGVGVITIITVLLVLCLTIFSALTLSSARADQRLSQINADTVSAYYAADGEAARLYAQFAAGSGGELDTTLPVSGTQSLHLHLVRTPDGGVRVLAWQTVSTVEPGLEEDYLPLWEGEPSDSSGE